MQTNDADKLFSHSSALVLLFVSQNAQHWNVDSRVLFFFSSVIYSRNFSSRCSTCGMCSRNAAKIPAVWANFQDSSYSYFSLLSWVLFSLSLLNSLPVRALVRAPCLYALAKVGFVWMQMNRHWCSLLSQCAYSALKTPGGRLCTLNGTLPMQIFSWWPITVPG